MNAGAGVLRWSICRLGGWQGTSWGRRCGVVGQLGTGTKWRTYLASPGWTAVLPGSGCRRLPGEAAWAGEAQDVSVSGAESSQWAVASPTF